ncbi:MAG: lipopolysaccharide biosynthesis protein [Flavobacteriales bacterium]|nr:lipopolysaccharide biosynthesis protein [Flavobacteriales bacterium]
MRGAMSGTGTSFTRNMMTLLGGTATAQVIPLLAAPVLTRLYTPEQFGALAILLAVANPLSLLVCGRYELTVVLPKADAEANLLGRLALLVGVGVSVALATVIWGFGDRWAVLFGGAAAIVPLLLAPVLISLMGVFQPINNWLIRKQAFRAMGVNKIVQTSGITGVSLALAWWAGGHGLLIGYVVGWLLYFLIGVAQARSKGFRFRPIDLPSIRNAAKAYRGFPLYNALPAVLNTAALSVPVFFLTRSFDEHVTGQFNLCRQTTFLPLTFFATSFMQVWTQRASSTVVDGVPVLPLLRRSVRSLGGLALAIATVLLIGGPWLFGSVFGKEWTVAGEYARILALPLAIQFVVMPLTPLLPALGRIRAFSIWQVCYFLAVLLAGLFTFAMPGDYLLVLAVLESLCFTALGILVYRSASNHDAQLAPA